MIVTIVTPTLNGAAYLRQCIDSVKRNHRPGFEVDHVIVDAGSTDNTVAIAREAGCRIIEGRDKGIFDAINKGSFNSKGDLLGFLGSDDLMLDGALEKIVATAERTRAGWIVGGIRWIGERGEDLGALAAPPSLMTARVHACLGWNPIMHMSTYFTRRLFTELGGFNIEYKDAGDYELFARALEREPYARIAAPLTCFRRTRLNNSVVNAVRANAEARAVLLRHGPRSTVEQLFWRQALKVWFNLRNPQWMAVKASAALRTRIDPAAQSYF
ncbi:glycosyltransferase family 2 protein [Aurantimonas sp. Leaf443]|uniref:glycosyltransferase family 2 protein n=1 Tax=Aurantimonas sp. Leaf443 TaxID=1736378 RepID=UPI0006FECEA2|nr:glycosyltransferase family 2 protein [Aurantimonas sp. Leaf443]KQT88367.1 glycosyl transferase [Aurantimonas sp. Leaf443]